jgi:hypothetical protein
MYEHVPNVRALWWEWAAARIVVGVGIALPLAAFLWLTIFPPKAPLWNSSPAAPAASQAEGRARAGEQLCLAATALTQTFGILPGYAKPVGGPQNSDIRGRYVCTAQTGAAKYTITFDLLCRALNDARCFSLFNVAQDDGSMLYQRQ